MRKEDLTEEKMSEFEKLINQILSDKGEFVDEFNEGDFGMYAIPMDAPICVPFPTCQVVRIIQVRIEAGDFGSDLVFCREMDWTLRPWHNTAFFRVKSKYKEQLDSFFKDTIEYDDSEKGKQTGYNYTGNRDNIVGFLIPSPYPEDHITPMKSVKASIYSKLDEIINKA